MNFGNIIKKNLNLKLKLKKILKKYLILKKKRSEKQEKI